MLRGQLTAALTCGSVVLMPALLLAQLPIPTSPAVDPATRFTVASIRPDNGIEPARFRIQASARVDITDAPVRLLVVNAFRVRSEHVVGLPDWADRDRYAITATASAGTSVSAVPTMLTNLLADRFKLVAHRETRDMQTFDLLLARNDGKLGPGLAVTSAECQAMVTAGAPAPAAAPSSPPDRAPCGAMQVAPGVARASGVPVPQFVRMLSQLVGAPVNDKTGLSGLYDLTLRFNPNLAADAVADPDLPHLFTALPEQLGLRLAGQRGPVEVVVVDRIERPTPD